MYLALVWTQSNVEQDIAAKRMRTRIRLLFKDWIEAVDVPGLFVATQAPPTDRIDIVYRQQRGHGVVLGRLFSRGGSSASSEQCLGEIAADPAKAFQEAYWGAYICFVKSSSREEASVLRSPGGEIPCQHVGIDGVNVYFARLPDVESMQSLNLHLNRRFFTGALIARVSNPEETAYREVSSLLPGARARHSAQGRTVDFFWNPLQIANEACALPHDEIVGLTRNTVQQCVQAWASCHESVSLQLSGGLDSTIVAACLGQMPGRPTVVCMNGYSNQGTADERVFAREVAGRWGFELLEVPFTGGSKLDLSGVPYRTVIPADIPTLDSSWPAVWREFSSRGVRCHFRGDGGDELFHRGGRIPDSVDFAYSHGLTPALWGVAMNDARIDETSVWGALQSAVKFGFLKRRYEWLSRGVSAHGALFVRETVQETLRDVADVHPLYREPLSIPPGKVIQSYGLLQFTCRVYAGPEEFDAPPTVHPLIAEPLMELLLRTPLWILRRGARDRSIAREAFRDAIPAAIRNRKYKGLYRAPVESRLEGRLPEVRDLLLDGYLVSEKIVSRHALEDVLLRSVPDQSTSSSLLSFLATERWVRQALAYKNESVSLELTA